MSHFIIMLLLVFGYNLSDILYYDEETYSTIEIIIPPSGFSTAGNIDVAELYVSISDILSGPLPVPTFDQFITLNQVIASSVDADELGSIVTESELGQVYGNLLTVGSLHFAPDSAEVEDLIDYLNRTTRTFRNLTVHKHATENRAIRYIHNHLEEYTLALIVLHSVSPEVLNYDIRQVRPNTTDVERVYSK